MTAVEDGQAAIHRHPRVGYFDQTPFLQVENGGRAADQRHADPFDHIALHGGDRTELHHDASIRKVLLEKLSGGRAGPESNEGRIVDPVEGHRRRSHEDKGIIAPRLTFGVSDDRQIELALREALHGFVRRRLAQQESNSRVCLPKPGQRRRQVVRAGGGPGPDPDFAPLEPRDLLHRPPTILQRR